jgi:hypothetical protein
MMLIHLLVLILVLLILQPLAFNGQHGGSLNAPFSLLESKEMAGILESEGGPSWSGRVNPKNPERPVKATYTSSPPMTYYGHGIPLKPVEPGPIMNPLKIVHNTKLAFKPECCPSPYSSDQGCLCGALEDISKDLGTQIPYI